MFDSSRPHELQHARPPFPSTTPRFHPNSCPSSQWCHPAISSSVVPFSSCLQSFPASECFPMSQLFAWGGQSSGVSALASVLPKNTEDWTPLEWTFWISLQSKAEKAMATHSSTLAWKIPWMEEPGRLQSMGSLRVGQDRETSLSLFTFMIGEGNGNPLQYSCLENPRDRGTCWAAVYGVTQSRTGLKRLSSSSSSSPRDSQASSPHHSSKASILQHSAIFTVQLSHPYMTTGKTIALTRLTFVGKVISLLLNMLSRLVITFLPRKVSVF